MKHSIRSLFYGLTYLFIFHSILVPLPESEKLYLYFMEMAHFQNLITLSLISFLCSLTTLSHLETFVCYLLYPILSGTILQSDINSSVRLYVNLCLKIGSLIFSYLSSFKPICYWLDPLQKLKTDGRLSQLRNF